MAEEYGGTRPQRDSLGPMHTLAALAVGPSLASRVQRGVARPVLRALGGNVPQRCDYAPPFDPKRRIMWREGPT